MTKHWTDVYTASAGDTRVNITDYYIDSNSIIKPYAQTASNTPVKYSSMYVSSSTAVIFFESALTEQAKVKLLIITDN